jgi:putative Mn2+ efflux pump MntP
MMTTRIGFYLFIGLILGAVVGNWLPYIASIETIAGGIIAVVVGIIIDRFSPENRGDDEEQT